MSISPESVAEDGSHFPLLLDACVVINLYATRRMTEIIAAHPMPVFIPSHVNQIEALWVGHGQRSDPASDAESVDLSPMIERQSIAVVAPEGESEAEMLVELASQLDDGEAECGAIASSRGFAVATDDRKAIRVFGMLQPPLRIVRTSQILERWERSRGISRGEIRTVLRDVRDRARFEPPPDDPLYSWWTDRAA